MLFRGIPVGTLVVEFRKEIVVPLFVGGKGRPIKEVQRRLFQILCVQGIITIGFQAEISRKRCSPAGASVGCLAVLSCQRIPVLPPVDGFSVGGSPHNDGLIPLFVVQEFFWCHGFRRNSVHFLDATGMIMCCCLVVICCCFRWCLLEPLWRYSETSAQVRSIDVVRVYVWYLHWRVWSKLIVFVVKQEHIGILPRGSNPFYDRLFCLGFPEHLVSPQLGLVAHHIEISGGLHQSSMRRSIAKGNHLLPQFFRQENFFLALRRCGGPKKTIPSGKDAVRMRILDAGKILQSNPFRALLAICSLRHFFYKYVFVVVDSLLEAIVEKKSCFVLSLLLLQKLRFTQDFG